MGSSSSRSRVTSLSLELEDKSKTLDALKQALRQARSDRDEAIRSAKQQAQDLLDGQRRDHEAAVNRHLGFIDKLLADKKQLAHKVEEVSAKVKRVEDRFEKQIESMAQRHANEVQQLKQSLAQQEALRRQKWQESKTKELKEMTIKGLEPEIQRILTKHRAEVRAMEERYKDRLQQFKSQLEREKQQELEEAAEANRKVAQREVARKAEGEEARVKELKRRHAEELQKQREEFKADTEVLLARQKQLLKDAQSQAKQELGQLKKKHHEELKQLEALRHGDKKILKQKLLQEKEEWQSQAIASMNAQSKGELKKWREKLLHERDQQLDTIITKLHEEAAAKERQLKQNYERKLKEELEGAEERVQQARDQEFQWRDKYQTLSRLQKEDKALFNSAGDRINKLLEAAEDREQKIETLNRQVACVNDRIAEREREVRAEYGDRMRGLTTKIAELEDELGSCQQLVHKENRQRKSEVQDVIQEKEAEIEEIHQRVRQTIRRKDETVDQLRDQVEELEFRLQQAEELIEKQRQQFVDS